MKNSMLRALLGARGQTVEQLRATSPALADEVLALVRGAEGARLARALGDLPDHVRAKVEEIDFTGATGNVVEHLRVKLTELGIEDEQIQQVVARAQKVKDGQGLQPGQVIGTQPEIAKQIATARVHEVSTVAELDAAATEVMAREAPAPSALDDATLIRLVSQRKLTDAQARDVGFSAALYALVGEDTALASAIRSASFPRLGGNSPVSTADLAKLSVADWTRFFTSTPAVLPVGATPERLGAALAARFATVHPAVAITARLPQADEAQVNGSVRALEPLFRLNPKVVGVGFSELVATGLDAPEIAALQTLHAQMVQLTRAYPGLELATVLDDPQLDAAAKTDTVARRVALVQGVSEQLGEVPMLLLDLSAGSPDLEKLGLERLDATNDEKRMVVSTLQTYQRTWAVAKNIDDAHALFDKGFTSAISMGTRTLTDFQARSGLHPEKATRVWDQARSTLASVAQTAASAVDMIQGVKLGVSNQSPAAEEYLKRLPGFEQMFGSLSFCDCEECKSILGPTAYFVDLMKYIDENLRPQFAGYPRHPLDLKTRRADLWDLELTCDNTNDRVPTLDLINEILERYVAQQQPGFGGSLDNPKAVGAQVYGDTLTHVANSFSQPFHLPLARIGSYLARLGHTRAEVADALGAPSSARTAAELGLSASELLLVSHPTDPGLIGRIDGLQLLAGATAVSVDARKLGATMGLGRDQLGQLVATDFVAAGGARGNIEARKKDAQSVQNDVEMVNGLTVDALDRMHRFTRLVGKVGWSIPDLDLVLSTLVDTDLGPSACDAIAGLHAAQARLGATVEEVCALVGDIPKLWADKSLFGRLFNPPSYKLADGAFPMPTTHLVHPAFLQNALVDQPTKALPRLLAGLSIDLDGLATLARRLAHHLAQEVPPAILADGLDSGDDNDRYFVLSAANLTLLYRHARLARFLRLSIDDLFQMLGLLGLDHVAGLADLLLLLDLHDWWRQSGYRLDDVAVATGQAPRDPTRYPTAQAVADQVVASAATALTFTENVFAVALGTTEQGSLDLLKSNAPTASTPGVVEPTEGGTWRLVAGVDLDEAGLTITIPGTALVPTPLSAPRVVLAAEVREALRPYLAREVLARGLGSALGLATDKVFALTSLAGRSLTAEDVVEAVRGGPIKALVDLVSAVKPLAVALSAGVWNAAARAGQPLVLAPSLELVALHSEAFGADPLPQTHPNAPFVSLAQLRALSTYARLAQRRLASVAGAVLPDALAPITGDLNEVLTAFDAAGFPQANDATMARVLGVPVGLVVGLRGNVTLPVTGAAALEQLDRAAHLASAIGVGGETLGALATDDHYYDRLSAAADALFAVLGARYSDEQTKVAKLDEAEQPIREAKRDALADYLIHSRTPQVWGSLDDLYQYFLIDVEAGGCSTTSRVVAATMTAQLYVYRAIMNLEQSESGDVALRMPAEAAEEWTWRKNYRVWQANRKVFLWPENYLEPDLRDDKSPLFKELEQELLQTDISDQNVLDAYTKYLAGFEEVGALTLAGAYHDVSSPRRPLEDLTGFTGLPPVTGTATSGPRPSGAGTSPTTVAPPPPEAPARVTDVLHLFGATATDPPIYYYRTCENLIASGRDPSTAAVWSPWQKIAVQITGRKVSPVVHEGRLRVFWVDIKTRSNNKVENGSSTFAGYRHQMSLKFTTLRVDGAWTAPQEVQLPGDSTGGNFGPAAGQIMDPTLRGVAKLDPQKRRQTEAIDDYTLSGSNWDWVWLHSSSNLEIQLRNFAEHAEVELFGRKLVKPAAPAATTPTLPHPQLLCAKDAGGIAVALADAAVEQATLDYTAAQKAAHQAIEALKHQNDADHRKARHDADARANAAKDALDAAKTAATSAHSNRNAPPSSAAAGTMALYTGVPVSILMPVTAFANAVIEDERLAIMALEAPSATPSAGEYTHQIATIPTDTVLLAVPGSEEDALLQVGSDLLLLQKSATEHPGYVVRRLGTTLVTDIARRLFEDGLDGLLDTQTQFALAEAGLPITRVGSRISTASFNGAVPPHPGKLDFTGPCGVYYRELFFHIPFLIANALNARGRFDAAQRWYHYVFDPTSADTSNIVLAGVPPKSEELAHRLLDRVWRYREFRGHHIEHLRYTLTSVDAIAQYEKDPFNPWAIARRRTSAFQKAIVMKYVDNLLDWADSLFTQFTMESVNEAMMLYIMASDILGPRPAKLGDCGTGESPVTYEKLGPLADEAGEILVEIETWVLGARASAAPSRAAAMDATTPKYAVDYSAIAHAVRQNPVEIAPASTLAGSAVGITARASSAAPEASAAPAPSAAGMFLGLGWNQLRTASWGPALSNGTIKSGDKLGGRRLDHARKQNFSTSAAGYGWSVLRQQLTTVFCVPVNTDLLAYWDRVTDRLYKLRNCMDIDGQKRELALLAPPIDPMQLVAMKAAGLSLDDVLGGTSGNLPPYRFLYLIERAKAFAGTLNGFGGALLSSLEKKDGEDLNRLRLTQQMNLTRQTTQTRQLEINAASEALEALNRQLVGAQRRSEYYAGLVDEERNPWEVAESIHRHVASITRATEVILQAVAGNLSLIPQAGSPFAMKYGGVELGGSFGKFATGMGASAGVSEAIAASSSLEGNFTRRREGWTEQKNVADDEIKVLDRQILAAQIHLDIANRALDLHQNSIDQMQEMIERTDGKFTNHGLYTWMSQQLSRHYRGAYQNALAMMKLAEQAYRFERGDDATPRLDMSYWDPTHAGLLAGEQMLVDLQTLERRFIETNYRTLEVEQSFTLTQLDPVALMNLREKGSCQFSIPEVFFDLSYPGHYRRQIKAVRVTVPCVTGPYTNVGATLTLMGSEVRAKADAQKLTAVPPQRTVSIATSRAQNDAGVFELSFHDERYMPFEGAGAVNSTWRLELPEIYRPFDYQTISDVVLTINYTALADGPLRQSVQQAQGAIFKSLADPTTRLFRLFSLRQEFPMAYKALLASPPGTPVSFEVMDWHFPALMTGRTINVTVAKLALKTVAGVALSSVDLAVDKETVAEFTDALGGLPATALTAFKKAVRGKHTLVVNTAGTLAPTAPQMGDLSAIDGQKVVDVLLYVEYGLG